MCVDKGEKECLAVKTRIASKNYFFIEIGIFGLSMVMGIVFDMEMESGDCIAPYCGCDGAGRVDF
jgi:hypothetical protein